MNLMKNTIRSIGSIGLGTVGVALGICGAPFTILMIPFAIKSAHEHQEWLDEHEPIPDAEDESEGGELMHMLATGIFALKDFAIVAIPFAPAIVCFAGAAHLWPKHTAPKPT